MSGAIQLLVGTRKGAWIYRCNTARQAFCADRADPLGLYLGTTGGELWMSDDEGGDWRCIARHLPEIYSVVAAPL